MTTMFPKYIRVAGTEMALVGVPEGYKATYFKPCGEWLGDLEYKDGSYYMRIIDHTHEGKSKSVLVEEITPLELLKGNPYGYSDTTKRVFEKALKDANVADSVIVKRGGKGYYYTHKYA